MSSSAGHPKTSSSGQRQLTFSQQASLSESIPDRSHTRHVGAAAVEELDSFHFGAPIVAKHGDGHSYRRDNACQQQITGDETGAQQTGG